MHIGILSARSQLYHPNQRLRDAGSRLGHRITLIHPRQCISCTVDGVKGFRGLASLPDVLLPRIGSTINEYAISLVRHFEESGARVINGFISISLSRNKFLTIQTLVSAGIPVPSSYLVSNPGNLVKAVQALGGYPVIVKTPIGRQGSGVMVLRDRPSAEFVGHNLPLREQGVIVQQYIPPEGRSDFRAFVIGEEIVGAVRLTPSSGDFRANVHLGGKPVAVVLPSELKAIAIKSVKVLGLDIGGVDMITSFDGKAFVVEVNYSPGFKGMEASTGLDIASRIISFAAEGK